MNSDDWKKEYQDFIEGPGKRPPESIGNRLKKMVEKDLNPPPWLVFTKLFAIHFISGALTLFICPQFNFGFQSENSSIFGIFLRLGEYGCMLVCGGIFLGATALAAAILLTPSEIRSIRNSRWLQWGLLALLSVGFFLSFREQEAAVPFGLVATWMAGALFGGVFVFQLTYTVRAAIQFRR